MTPASTAAKLARPVTVTLPSGDWDMVAGLLIQEATSVNGDANRKSYYYNLMEVRRLIFQAQERARA